MSVLQPGTAPEGFDFPEKKLSINATAEVWARVRVRVRVKP